MRIKPFHIIVVLLTAATVAAYVAGIYLDRQFDSEPPSNVPLSAYIKNVNSRDEGGRTPLMMAAKRGDVESVRDLIVRGADVNAKNNKGHSSLNYAAEKGHTGVVRLLLDSGADINAKSYSGTTALMLAAEGNHVDTARLLLERGANTHIKQYGKYTAIEIAATNGRTDIIRLFAEHGEDVDEYNPDSRLTPIVWAANNGHLETVKAMVEMGVDVKGKKTGVRLYEHVKWSDNEDLKHYILEEDELSDLDEAKRAMILACREGDSAKALALIDGGAYINTMVGYTPLMFAVRSGDIEFEKALLDRGADMNIRGYTENSALDYAIEKGDSASAMLLLDRGADPNKKLNSYRDINDTPLMVAARKGLTGVVVKLIEKGADVDTGNEDGWNPLRCAVGSGNIETAKALVDHCAQMDGKWGMAVCETASAKGNPAMILMLMEFGKPDLFWKNAFDAAESGDYGLLDKMLSRGLDANLRDGKGGTMLDIARSKEDGRLEKLLVSHGAVINPHPEDFNSFFGRFWANKDFQLARTKFPVKLITWQDCDGALMMGEECEDTIESWIEQKDWGCFIFNPSDNTEEVFTCEPDDANCTGMKMISCVPETDNCIVLGFALVDGMWYLVRYEG